jgi:hypothetical protein
MSLVLPEGEPQAGPWRAANIAEVVGAILDAAGPRRERPRVVAIDGRSAGGKSTLTDRLRAASTAMGLAAAVVHTDDVAWYESFFGWAPLMIDGVLAPLHAGHGVRFQPPAWAERGREGAIEVPAPVGLVLVEGVGASRRELSPFLDASIWVQSDLVEAERRVAREAAALGVNGDEDETREFWDLWMGEELPFLARDRPWERAALVVAGTAVIPLRDDEVAIAGPVA